MNKRTEEEFTSSIKQSLDDSIEGLDANTLSSIRQIRARAVDKVNMGKQNWLGIVTGGLATACVMVFAAMVLLQSPNLMQTVPIDDLELISSSDSLELFEDLEFYEWLEEDALLG